MTASETPKVVRIWRGRTRREIADEYAAYLAEVGIPPLKERALGVQSFREDREDETEFITVSYWPDIPSMTGFSGDDPTAVHHLDRDPEYLIELPERVEILSYVSSFGSLASDTTA